jgi:phosphoserine aminotransferase
LCRQYCDVFNVLLIHHLQLEFETVLDPIFRVSNTDVGQGDVSGVKKPMKKPRNPEFSSGPCKKRPGYELSSLRTNALGRSHRSALGKSRLKKAIEDTRRILKLPDDYLCGIVPASDTGAFEMAMWNFLGNNRPVDACYWESFGQGWRDDATKHLNIETVNEISAGYGELPDLTRTNSDHDIMFTFNGTTSGVRVPDLNWISDDRKGLTFNDCTSAAFAMDIDWNKTDISTFSWQKVLGGEGAHGMMILSPRAVERLETEPATRPLPKIFRMLKKGKIDGNIFKGDTINTPSMLCVEDYIDAMGWAEGIGGLDGMISKSMANLNVLKKFVSENHWIDFLAQDEATLSNTSVCLTLKLDKDQTKRFISLLEAEAVAFDIGSYRDAPDGLRIWCGATVDAEDLELLMPWLSVRSMWYCNMFGVLIKLMFNCVVAVGVRGCSESVNITRVSLLNST